MKGMVWDLLSMRPAGENYDNCTASQTGWILCCLICREGIRGDTQVLLLDSGLDKGTLIICFLPTLGNMPVHFQSRNHAHPVNTESLSSSHTGSAKIPNSSTEGMHSLSKHKWLRMNLQGYTGDTAALYNWTCFCHYRLQCFWLLVTCQDKSILLHEKSTWCSRWCPCHSTLPQLNTYSRNTVAVYSGKLLSPPISGLLPFLGDDFDPNGWGCPCFWCK